MTYVDTLVALADPTRRAMFEALRERPRTVGELAERVRVRQPTASQHLRVLRHAALVTHSSQGTRRYYQASREGLDALRRYVESLWDDVLSAYAGSDTAPNALAKSTTRKPRARKATSSRRRAASRS
jgi:DNA-binding transcriptional ArsR family regulator